MKLTAYEKKVSITFGVAFILMIVSSLLMLNGCGASEVDNKPDSVETVNEQAASGSAVSEVAAVTDEEPVIKGYYGEHTEEEVRADVDAQLALIAKEHKWLTDYKSDYRISDQDQDGLLEITGHQPDYKVYEVDENRSKLVDATEESQKWSGDGMDYRDYRFDLNYQKMQNDGSGYVNESWKTEEDILTRLQCQVGDYRSRRTNETLGIDYKKIYAEYIAEHKDDFKTSDSKDIYVAIVDSEEPVLLMTDSSAATDELYEDGCAFRATIFGYSKEKGEVVRITGIESTGSGYPLMQDGKRIVSGFHHWSDRYVAGGDSAIDEKIEGMGYDKDTGMFSVAKVKEGQEEKLKEITVPIEMADALDFYTDTWKNGRIIPFNKIAEDVTGSSAIYAILNQAGFKDIDQEKVYAEHNELEKMRSFIQGNQSKVAFFDDEMKAKWRKRVSKNDEIYEMLSPMTYIYSEESMRLEYRFRDGKLIRYEFKGTPFEPMLYLSSKWWDDESEVRSGVVKFAEVMLGKKESRAVSIMSNESEAKKIVKNHPEKFVIYPTILREEYKSPYEEGEPLFWGCYAFEDTDGGEYVWDAGNRMIVSYVSPVYKNTAS